MWFLDYIIERLADARDWLLDAYLEVAGWIWPFYYLKYPLYGLYVVFYYLTRYFGYFNDWLEWAAGRIGEIISEWDIWSILATPISWAQKAWDWVYYAASNIWEAVGRWWEATRTTVLGWIDTAYDYALSLYYSLSASVHSWIDAATGWFKEVAVAWDHFWRITLPGLLDYLKLEYWWDTKLWAVDGLIGSKLAEWFPFYDDLVEFVSDPGEYLLAKFTDWFLGKEE
ncbi:hypothetical protein ES708_09873 [subsurface metagenome]